MQATVSGHKYEVNNVEEGIQTIAFIHKEEKDDVLETVEDGTTNEEVIAVLIDRLQFLQSKLSSRETALAITKLEEALMWLEKRTADRQKRGVEATHTA